MHGSTLTLNGSRKAIPHTSAPDEKNMELAEPPVEPVDESKLIEERRKRREAIKAKYKGHTSPPSGQALQLRVGIEAKEEKVEVREKSERPESPSQCISHAASMLIS